MKPDPDFLEADVPAARLQVVQIFDSWAGFLAPSHYQEFSLAYAQQVIDGVRAQRPGTPLIFHANGGEGSKGCIRS